MKKSQKTALMVGGGVLAVGIVGYLIYNATQNSAALPSASSTTTPTTTTPAAAAATTTTTTTSTPAATS